MSNAFNTGEFQIAPSQKPQFTAQELSTLLNCINMAIIDAGRAQSLEEAVNLIPLQIKLLAMVRK